MEYRIARDGNTYGPYTEAELREYFAAGNVVANDLVRSSEMDDWQPLREVLPKLKRTARRTARKRKRDTSRALDPAGLRPDLPSPPDMPWWMAMILEALTVTAFFVAWDIVEGVWLYRVQRGSRALWYFCAAGLLFAINAPAIRSVVAHNAFEGPRTSQAYVGGLAITAFVLRIVARFSMRKSLLEHFNEREPIGLKLSWWMTLLFGGLYFQYHFNRINEMKRVLAAKAIAA
jgi:hypothetical protein